MTPATPNQLPLVAELLRQLAPPAGVIHVGVGQGLGTVHLWRQWPEVQNAWLFDAAEPAAPWLVPALQANSQWHYSQAVLAAQAQEATFYSASNPAESGLLSPEGLQSIWPNLRTVAQTVTQTVPLDQACSVSGDANWLLIDCLPALPVLQGASQLLPRCQVVWVRVLLADNAPPGCALAAAQALLQSQQFKLLTVCEEINPAVGVALFVQDWPQLVQSSLARISQAAQDHAVALATVRQQAQSAQESSAELQAQLAQAILQRDAEVKAKADVTAQRDVLANEKNQLIGQRDTLAKEKADLIAGRDAEAKAKAEVTAQRDALANEKNQLIAQRDLLAKEKANLAGARDAEAHAKAEAQARVTALEQKKNQLEHSGVAEAQAKADLAARNKELQDRLDKACAQNTELVHRQLLMQEEIVKAEAQIAHIKDFLLPEQEA